MISSGALNYGPDRNTRPARFKLPPGACDAHAHVYGPPARFPYPGNPPVPPRPDAPFEDYARMHAALGIERGVLVQTSRYGTDNRALLDALARGGPHLRGIVSMPVAELTEKTVADLDARGVRGVRVHEREFPDLEGLCERIAGAGWRIEVSPPKHIAAFTALRSRIEKLPCPIVIERMGTPDPFLPPHQPHFAQILAMVREGTLWAKLSHAYLVTKKGPPYDDVLTFAQSLAQANPARLVWGSDWPHNTRWEVPNDGLLLDLLADWVPDEGVRNRILVDNPQVLNRF